MHPHKTTTSLLVAFFSLAMLLLPLAAAEPSTYVPRGEWLVSGQEVLSNGPYLFTGNITVASGGELRITNSKVIFDSNNITHVGFVVQEGGKISVMDSTITTTNWSEGFVFFCHGGLKIQRSRIENIYDTTKGLKWIAGFRITSDNPIIEDSVFDHATGYALRFEGCGDVRFTNNTVTQASTAILMNRSTGIVEGNWFHNNTDRQVVIQESDGVQFLNNVVNETDMAALVVVGSTNLKAENNTYAGGFYVIYAAGSTLKLSGENISGEQIQLEAGKNSAVSLLNCDMDLQKLQTKDNSNIEVKDSIEVRVTSGGKPMKGAIVTAKDSTGGVVSQETTDEDGIAHFTLKKGDITDSGLNTYDPYEFKAAKGLHSASGSLSIYPMAKLELTMKLPWLYIIGFGVFAVLVVIVVVSPPKSSGKKKKRKK